MSPPRSPVPRPSSLSSARNFRCARMRALLMVFMAASTSLGRAVAAGAVCAGAAEMDVMTSRAARADFGQRIDFLQVWPIEAGHYSEPAPRCACQRKGQQPTGPVEDRVGSSAEGL